MPFGQSLCLLVHKSLLGHARIYLRRSDIGRQYSRSIYTARFIMWQPRRAADTSTELSLLLHREHETGCRRSWNCCDRRTRFVVIWKHFCFILSTGTRMWIESVMCPRSSSRGRNTSASVTVTWPPSTTVSVLPLIQLSVHLSTSPLVTFAANFETSLQCGTLTKAFLEI